VLSRVSLSEDQRWRAYIEVDVQSGPECLHTTRLCVARDNAPYRLVYLMPPKRTAVENGMEILGWAKNSSMLLVKTEEWQWGSECTRIATGGRHRCRNRNGIRTCAGGDAPGA
jgi:hypothetical protein